MNSQKHDRISFLRRPRAQNKRLKSGFSGTLLMIIAIASLTTSACFESKVVTSKINDPDVKRRPKHMNGIFYALPRTIVRADVPVARVDKEPGQFVEHIKCFFPDVKDDDYTRISSTEFKVAADKIKFDTGFVPDTEEIYMIQTQGGMFETRNLEVDLTESGVLVKATGESTNETIDIVTGTIKTAVGLAAKASNLAMLSSGVEVASFEKKLPFEQRQCWNRLEEPFAISVRRAQLKIDSSGKPPLDDSERERRLEEEIDKDLLSKRSSFIQAQNAFEQIAALELQRNDLFHGTNIPPDTLKLMIDELDKRIASSRGEFFFGTKETLTWNPTFRLNPTPASKSVDLFTFSKAKGVCEILANKPPHNQGVSFDARFRLEGVCSDASTVSLAIQEGENGEGGPDSNTQFAQIVSGSKLKSDGARGFYYRIPGRAVAFLKKADTELARAPLSIAQFGEVVSLPASTGGRRTKYTLALYEASGGLKNFVMGSDALIKQKNIDDIAGGAQTAIEAKGERKKAKAPADELQQLERQRKILEERKKIKDLEKELDTGNPSP